MNSIKLSILAAFSVLALGSFMTAPAFAAQQQKQCTDAASCITQGVNDAGGSGNKTSLQGFFKNIVNVLLYIIGAVSVIMIIFGGIRYTTSNGDSSAVTAAKNTIMYAVIGLIVAILAYAIVNFVVTSIK